MKHKLKRYMTFFKAKQEYQFTYMEIVIALNLMFYIVYRIGV